MTCSDGSQDGFETDVDCGGSSCAPCGDGLGCFLPADCLSQVCTGGFCQTPTCTDGLTNGMESDIDCGGTCPDRCGDGQGCYFAGDQSRSRG